MTPEEYENTHKETFEKVKQFVNQNEKWVEEVNSEIKKLSGLVSDFVVWEMVAVKYGYKDIPKDKPILAFEGWRVAEALKPQFNGAYIDVHGYLGKTFELKQSGTGVFYCNGYLNDPKEDGSFYITAFGSLAVLLGNIQTGKPYLFKNWQCKQTEKGYQLLSGKYSSIEALNSKEYRETLGISVKDANDEYDDFTEAEVNTLVEEVVEEDGGVIA